MSCEIKVTSFGEEICVKRILGKKIGKNNAPTVIVFGGIHGNERAGINALISVFDKIEKGKFLFEGNFYGIAGNINAIAKNLRFEDVDLNRIWTNEIFTELNARKEITNEFKEQKEIHIILKDIVQKHKGPFYFLDLHTTSADTQPFITISDSLNNRKFSSKFKLPTILGIEEFLEGPLLTFINEYGHIAMGFEAGQHYSKSSVINCEAFIWMALEASKCIKKSALGNDYEVYKNTLSNFKIQQQFYKIESKYTIKPDEDFKMEAGFENFQNIKDNELLAYSNQQPIYAEKSGKIFMPLYQNKGDDGFFMITKLSFFWLQLSKVLRKIKFHKLFTLLPGIQKSKENEYTLIVNPKVAKFLAIDIFHLFGFRKRIVKDNYLHFTRRDRKIQNLP